MLRKFRQVIGWGSFATLAFMAVFHHQKVLEFPGQLLVKESPQEQADLIFVLMGNVPTRTPLAAKLYHEGAAPTIVFAKTNPRAMEDLGFYPNDGEATQRYLQQLGVPAEAIRYYESPIVSSTRDEAVFLSNVVTRDFPYAKKVVVITDWFHSSRAFWIVNKYAEPSGLHITIRTASGENDQATDWYKTKGGITNTFMEYSKWAYYLAKY